MNRIEDQMSNVVKLKQFLLDHNRSQSEIYCSPDAEWARYDYRISHPTEIAALKCMDGRINLPVITGIPPGIIQPYRTIGGQFDLGEKRFAGLISDWVKYSASRQRDCLVLVTYHWSRGDQHRGCAGFKYDTEKAKAFTVGLRNQFERVYGSGHVSVYPIRVGVETDLDTLVFHNSNDKKILDLSTLDEHIDQAEVEKMIHGLYPDMKLPMVKDLLHLAMGNIKHIAEVRRADRPIIEMDHREQVLALGRGYPWLHLPNKALIIGPYSYDLSKPIAVAGNLILKTLDGDKKLKKQGAIFMVSAPYRGDTETPATERQLAIEQAESLARFGAEVIKEKVPDLVKHLDLLVGTLNQKTLLFTPNNLDTKYL